MGNHRITLGEVRELQGELERSRLERTREHLARRFYNASEAQVAAAARLLVASDHTGQAAVRLSETGEIALADSERARHVQTLLRGCQGGYGSIRALTADEAKVKRLAEDEGITEDEAWTKLANAGEVEF
ncbi:MAG: hypothetical protein M3R38_17640 [Actinomycetota bacterium]|nr:hypothetical protein [Actinomycetota bacterium]